MKLKFFAVLIVASLLSACQGPPPPQIRFGELGDSGDKMQLSNEIAKALIRHGLSNEIVVVKVEKTTSVEDLLAEKFDVTLFAENPDAKGVPSKCSAVSKEAVTFGEVSAGEDLRKLARCDLSNKDKRVFDLIAKFKLSSDGLDDALFWKSDNKATIVQSALYYLHNNRVGDYGYAAWLPESGVQGVKAAIAKEMQDSKLPY